MVEHCRCLAGMLEDSNLQDSLVMVSSRVSLRAEVMRTGIGKLPCQSPFSCSKADPFHFNCAPWLPDSELHICLWSIPLVTTLALTVCPSGMHRKQDIV